MCSTFGLHIEKVQFASLELQYMFYKNYTEKKNTLVL